MSSHHPSEPSSAVSTPRSEHHLPLPPHRWHYLHLHDDGVQDEDTPGPRVRLMCSFGGRIIPRPHDHQLRYVGGETRIVALPRAATFASLLAKLSKLSTAACAGSVQVKYQLPHEELDALISITSDEDVEIMMEEHDRLAALGGGTATRTPRLRLFLFPPGGGGSGFESLHGGDDRVSRSDRWFLDALNGGAGAASLERVQSEVSSVVSEVPDYLFGLDSNSDQPEPVHRVPPNDPPESPVRRGPSFPESPVHRAPNSPPEPPIPGPRTPPPDMNRQMLVEEPVQQSATPLHTGSQPWQYMTEPVPVYFVPAPAPQSQVGPVPVPLHMSYGLQPGNHTPVQVVYQHVAQGLHNSSIRASPTGPVYGPGPPMAQTGPVAPYGLPVPVPDGYSLPTLVDGLHYGVGGHGMVVPLNPTAGLTPREELH